MKLLSLKNMTNGWFIGKFKPSVYSTNEVEVSVKRYKKGDSENTHYHKVATEVTTIVSGSVKMNGRTYKKDDIVIIKPFESTDFFAIEDVITVVVKIPGTMNDKYKGHCK